MNYEIIAEEIFSKLRNNYKDSLNKLLSEFTSGEIGVLGYLVFEKDKVTSGELSEKLNVSTARVASILNSLENKGYIKRTNDNLDKRKTLVTITNKGEKLAYSVKRELTSKIINVIKEVGEEDIKEYIRISLKIENVLNK